jgi:hypothetical protein
LGSWENAKNSTEIAVRVSNRREFLGTATQATIACGLASAALGEARAQTRPLADYRYADVHVHLGQPWNERGELTPAMLLRWMDAHQIAEAWVLPLISPESWFYPITTEWVLEQTKPFRDRVIPFYAVDPRSAVMEARIHFEISCALSRRQGGGS